MARSITDIPLDTRKSLRHLFKYEGETVTNARIKQYLFKSILQTSNDYIFNVGDYVRADEKSRRPWSVSPKGEAKDPERSLDESQRRARAAVYSIALCNRFTHMFTWTLDPKVIDRTDADLVYQKCRAFLSNATQRKAFSYVLIPEYHPLKPGQDKPGIHFHGLCSLGLIQVQRSIKKNRPRCDKAGRPVFNMLDWKLGWSTVVPLDSDYERAVGYITKYITKQDVKILGKWYLSSRNLKKRPDIIPLAPVDFYAGLDDMKLEAKEQVLSKVWRDILICTEDL